ncbi:uncharacterized protein LOC124145399 [Haliotis rufescens]|uniref:uncharacterized protein LOC124145399 n=1 Tax=Haliotis rufescens TaxID=6454 RepID=UPI00201FAB18|nr:uncharacterized protein LOC124145399 [Haliotis rufescens]XP_048251687.1 uncharacterized protein LOC124145399 [Haliotis rufescens]XP_048251688.1 uncharacterized protein LOC124145399 [Haliotis rufescens]
MLRESHALVLLLVMLMLMPESDGWWWGGRRRRRVVIQQSHDTNTNNCHCGATIKELLDLLRALRAKKLGRRDVATILDVDEGDPLLAGVMQKRDGVVAKEELYDAAKRAATRSQNTNQCHCGQQVLQQLGRSLD